MRCEYSPCAFVKEDDTAADGYSYSAYCLNCGGRDPQADSRMYEQERRQDALDSLEVDWTWREDGDYSRTDRDGNDFHICVIPPSVAGDKPYMLYRRIRASRWELVGSFAGIVDAVLRSQAVARDLRLAAAGVPDEPPF